MAFNAAGGLVACFVEIGAIVVVAIFVRNAAESRLERVEHLSMTKM